MRMKLICVFSSLLVNLCSEETFVKSLCGTEKGVKRYRILMSKTPKKLGPPISNGKILYYSVGRFEAFEMWNFNE